MKTYPLIITQKQILDSLDWTGHPAVPGGSLMYSCAGIAHELPAEFLIQLPARSARQLAGKILGTLKTRKQSEAARENGKKGGRPKGQTKHDKMYQQNFSE